MKEWGYIVFCLCVALISAIVLVYAGWWSGD
jgi:hypothetical protein